MKDNYEVLAKRSKKVIYKDGDTVVKEFDSDFSKADILNEALNQARIEETGLNVPKLLEVSKIDGKWAIRLEYIPGKTLKDLMDENPDKLDEYLELCSTRSRISSTARSLRRAMTRPPAMSCTPALTR